MKFVYISYPRPTVSTILLNSKTLAKVNQENPSSNKVLHKLVSTLASLLGKTSPLLFHFNNYNLGFNHKTLAAMSLRDGTLTLVDIWFSLMSTQVAIRDALPLVN